LVVGQGTDGTGRQGMVGTMDRLDQAIPRQG